MSEKGKHACFCAYNRSMDLKTPRNVKLTAFYRRSFAFKTVRDRLPIILTKTIDGLAQNKDVISKRFGNEASDDLKAVIGQISKLKYEIQTNKPLREFTSCLPDAAVYNDIIREREGLDGLPTPYHTVWLLVECYMYRKIFEAFEKTKYLIDFDPFRSLKEEQFFSAIPLIKEVAAILQQISGGADKKDFSFLLQFNLWSNKCDLSLSPDGVKPIHGNQIAELSHNILVNESDKVWETIVEASNEVIDIVTDNTGLELVADLALADYLISNQMCQKVNFHVKKIPWFVSDVTKSDLDWTVEKLNKMYEEPSLQAMGENWTKHFELKEWTTVVSDFWTLPVDFSLMHRYRRKLYENLSTSIVIFVKGDLSYRKLFREINHSPDTSIHDAQGYFAPAPICALRTVKSEIICGISEEINDKMNKIDSGWMEKGDYGLIQYSDKIVPLLDSETANKLSTFLDTPCLDSEWTPTLTKSPSICLCRN